MSVSAQKMLVLRLLKRSILDGLDWKPTIDDNAFQVSINENTVRVEVLSLGGGGGDDYVVSLIDRHGLAVDTFSDGELSRDTGEDDPQFEGGWFVAMKNLYELARRKALGSDKVLKKVLDDLDDFDE